MTTKCKPIPNYLLEKWKAEASNSQKWHGEDLAIADTRILSLIIEVEWLRKDQDDWRKGVDLIRAPLVKFAGKQLPTLCCVTISNAVLEVCAEVERLRKEVSNFHMDYRMKCDIPIQKQLNNDGSLVEPIPENK